MSDINQTTNGLLDSYRYESTNEQDIGTRLSNCGGHSLDFSNLDITEILLQNKAFKLDPSCLIGQSREALT